MSSVKPLGLERDNDKANKPSTVPSDSALKSIEKGTKNISQDKKVSLKRHKLGKRRGKNRIKNLRILFVNANGIKDKITSLQTAAEEYGAHIIAVAETKQIPPKLEGYGQWKSKERPQKAGGGQQ